jgi:hypothetical protein
VADRPGIVQKLEDNLAAALRDYNLHALAGGVPVEQSALAEYDRLVKDARVSIGIRYLALHSVAVKQGFYIDKRDQQEMLGTVAQEMGKMSPTEVLQGIQHLKSNYLAIYQSDAAALDRYESHAVEFMTRLPIDQQDKAVAEAKNVQLNARPITSGASEVIDPAPVKIPVVAPEPFIPPAQSSAHAITQSHIPQSSQPTQLPIQNNSKGALIIGSGMIAGAIIFSTAIMSSKSNQTSTSISNSTQQPNVTTKVPNKIQQDEAKKIIERWIQAKQRMFAPPYDQELGSQLTTGKAYTDKVRGPSSDGTPYSSLEWLRQYGYRYQYNVQNIEGFTRFESSGDKASIEVQILEDAKLYNKEGTLQPKRSGLERNTVRFILKKDNGVLKISDYNVLGESKRKS